jgi:hypothetical protein
LRGILLLTCCAVAACGGTASGPSPPSPSPVPLRPGLQLLTLSGVALSTDPTFPPCAPIGVPRDGTAVDTFVMLTMDGQDWVARSRSAAEGDIELRIHATGRTLRGHTVTGTIRGTGIDVGLNSVIRDVRVTLAAGTGSGPAALDGETLSPLSAFVGGRAAGALRFSDSRGAANSCAVIQWAMQPY